MGIEIKNTEVIIKAVKERLDAQKKEFRQAVEDAATEIVVRTKSGKDVDGSTFAPYTPEYAKYKGEKRKRNTSPPDLTLSGNMLTAIQTDFEESSTELKGKIYFNSALEAAKAHGNMQTRNFFGLSDEQVTKIRQRIDNAK